MTKLIASAAFAVCLVTALAPQARASSLGDALESLRQAPTGAVAQKPQAAAWKVVAAADAEKLPQILASMEGATPTGENWLRGAADAVAERQIGTADGLSPQLLSDIILDAGQSPRGRAAAFEWLERVDVEAAESLLPRMVDDPSLELRRRAIERLIAEANASSDDAQLKARYQQAFAAARDLEQIQEIAKELRDLGEHPDLVAQMGFLTTWRVIGPFANVDNEGFHAAYPPEKELDFSASYSGKSETVAWRVHKSDDEQGKVDLNAALGDDKEVVGYAAAEIISLSAQEVEIRLGCKNAPKAWLNGEPIGAFEIYHAGYSTDQYVMPVKLKRGRNIILVKVCQNAKSKSWEKEWEFQLRVTDALGGAARVEQEPLVPAQS
ncbi:hypothetical protein OAS39_00455 [Pirellulales bacterium]|nr:hypothetical protein [Pirellulales bacterium]